MWFLAAKRVSVLINFSDNWRFSLILHQNMLEDCFSKDSCNIECKTISILHFTSLKYNVVLGFWMSLLPMHDSEASHIDHLEVHRVMLKFLNAHPFHNRRPLLPKITFIKTPLISSEKSLIIGKLASSWRWMQIFQNANFCLKAQLLKSATRIVNSLPYCDSRIPFIFEKMNIKYPSLISIVYK